MHEPALSSHSADQLSPFSHAHTTIESHERRRAAWRQTLVAAERGLASGLRRDSSMMIHIFTICLLAMAAMVLGVTGWQWMLLILTFTLSVVVELNRQVLHTIADGFRHQKQTDIAERIDCLATAILVTIWVGGGCVTTTILISRIVEQFR